MIHFYKTPIVLKKMFPGLQWNGATENRELYLTFDDGPIPGLTPFVLDVLRDYGVLATFFCVGDNIRKHGDIFDKVVLDGHAVGNHTYNHWKAWEHSATDYLENVLKCDEMMERAGVKTELLFRPPYGQITPGLIKKVKTFHRIIMWDILSYDFAARPDAGLCLEKIVRYTRQGSIVVFHDNYKAESKLRFMLPKYIEHFLSLGFQFKKLTAQGGGARAYS